MTDARHRALAERWHPGGHGCSRTRTRAPAVGADLLTARGKVFFHAFEPPRARALGDGGTRRGTHLVKDIGPGPANAISGDPDNLFTVRAGMRPSGLSMPRRASRGGPMAPKRERRRRTSCRGPARIPPASRRGRGSTSRPRRRAREGALGTAPGVLPEDGRTLSPPGGRCMDVPPPAQEAARRDLASAPPSRLGLSDSRRLPTFAATRGRGVRHGPRKHPPQ